MCIKRIISLMISVLLLVNPSVTVFAEEVENGTVIVKAPDEENNLNVTQTVDGILIQNGPEAAVGAQVEAKNLQDDDIEDTAKVSAGLTVKGDVEVASNVPGEVTGIQATAENGEATVSVEGSVTVEGNGTATAVKAEASHDGSVDINTGDLSASSSGEYHGNSKIATGIDASGSEVNVNAGQVKAHSEQINSSADANGVTVRKESDIGTVKADNDEPDRDITISVQDITAEAESKESIARGLIIEQKITDGSYSDLDSKEVSNASQAVTVSVGNNVTATAVSTETGGASYAFGISEYTGITSSESGQTISQTDTISIGGDVAVQAESKGHSEVRGIDIMVADNEPQADSNVTQKIDIRISGNVSAEAKSTETHGDDFPAMAESVYVAGRSNNADVNITIQGGISSSASSVSGSKAAGVVVDFNNGLDIDVNVDGDINVASEATDINKWGIASGVLSDVNRNGENTIVINGNMTVTAAGEAKDPAVNTEYAGRILESPEETEQPAGRSTIEIGGNLTVSALSDSVNAYAYGLSVDTKGNEREDPAISHALDNTHSPELGEDKFIMATGAASNAAESNVTVGGNISVLVDAPEGSAYGVDVSGTDKSNVAIDISGGIEVVALVDNGEAVGILSSIEGDKGKIAVHVGDDVTADQTGIITLLDEGATGKIDIRVDGDVTGKENYGAQISSAGNSDAVAKLIVDGTLSGGEAGVLVEPTVKKDNVDLTVWQVNLTEVGGENHAVVTHDAEEQLVVTKETKAIEQDIRYIIRVEAPVNGNISLEGTEKVGNYDTAKEGENVVMKISANAGYHVTAAYNGEGQQVPLLKDANNNYYVIVPRGGGVYLSAVIDQDAVESNDSGLAENDHPSSNNTAIQNVETTKATLDEKVNQILKKMGLSDLKPIEKTKLLRKLPLRYVPGVDISVQTLILLSSSGFSEYLYQVTNVYLNSTDARLVQKILEVLNTQNLPTYDQIFDTLKKSGLKLSENERNELTEFIRTTFITNDPVYKEINRVSSAFVGLGSTLNLLDKLADTGGESILEDMRYLAEWMQGSFKDLTFPNLTKEEGTSLQETIFAVLSDLSKYASGSKDLSVGYSDLRDKLGNLMVLLDQYWSSLEEALSSGNSQKTSQMDSSDTGSGAESGSSITDNGSAQQSFTAQQSTSTSDSGKAANSGGAPIIRKNAAANSYRPIKNGSNPVNNNLEKLSSGNKINSSADNAAEEATLNKLQNEVHSNDAPSSASRNTTDVDEADEKMKYIKNNLSRNTTDVDEETEMMKYYKNTSLVQAAQKMLNKVGGYSKSMMPSVSEMTNGLLK